MTKGNPAFLPHTMAKKKKKLTFQWTFVALQITPMYLTETLSLAKGIGSMQILSSLIYICDICSETISVSKVAPHPSK